MPDIDFAFLADAAETIPGQKFHVLGGGVARIGGRRFPLRHPHLALVIGLQVTAPETDREHEIRFVLLDPDGGEVAGATGSLVARSQRDGRDAVLTFSIDLWNLTFPAPGDYSFRILVNGSERKRLPLLLLAPPDPACRRRDDGDQAGRRLSEGRAADDEARMTEARIGGPSRRPARHERPAIDEAGLVAARHADRLLAGAREVGSARWVAYLEPLPDRLRDDDPPALRATATRCRAAYGVKDSIRDVAAGRADRAIPRRDRPAHPRAQSRRPRSTEGLTSPSSSGPNASSRNGDGTAGS